MVVLASMRPHTRSGASGASPRRNAASYRFTLSWWLVVFGQVSVIPPDLTERHGRMLEFDTSGSRKSAIYGIGQQQSTRSTKLCAVADRYPLRAVAAMSPRTRQLTTAMLNIGFPQRLIVRSHSGRYISVARAPVMSPRSITCFHPNQSRRMVVTSAFASASFPPTNIVCSPPATKPASVVWAADAQRQPSCSRRRRREPPPTGRELAVGAVTLAVGGGLLRPLC
jgi:hypothetical protein